MSKYIALSSLGVTFLVLGGLELARGRWNGAILIAVAIAWGVYWGARGGVPTPAKEAEINTENAKTSALSRWHDQRHA
jgi:hypothetical protein